MCELIHEADPQSRPGSDHYFRTWCPSVPTFQNFTKQNKFQVNIVIAIGETEGLAEWIIDDTCPVLFIFGYIREIVCNLTASTKSFILLNSGKNQSLRLGK